MRRARRHAVCNMDSDDEYWEQPQEHERQNDDGGVEYVEGQRGGKLYPLNGYWYVKQSTTASTGTTLYRCREHGKPFFCRARARREYGATVLQKTGPNHTHAANPKFGKYLDTRTKLIEHLLSQTETSMVRAYNKYRLT